MLSILEGLESEVFDFSLDSLDSLESLETRSAVVSDAVEVPGHPAYHFGAQCGARDLLTNQSNSLGPTPLKRGVLINALRQTARAQKESEKVQEIRKIERKGRLKRNWQLTPKRGAETISVKI